MKISVCRERSSPVCRSLAGTSGQPPDSSGGFRAITILFLIGFSRFPLLNFIPLGTRREFPGGDWACSRGFPTRGLAAHPQSLPPKRGYGMSPAPATQNPKPRHCVPGAPPGGAAGAGAGTPGTPPDAGPGAINIGGLIGFTNGTPVSGGYWDTETTGVSVSDGGTGKKTADMKKKATYQGWDFNNIWKIDEGTNYPKLRSQYSPDGTAWAGLNQLAQWWLMTCDPSNDFCDGQENTGDATVNFEDFARLAMNWDLTAETRARAHSPSPAMDASAVSVIS